MTDTIVKKSCIRIAKYDSRLGIAFGWGAITSVSGEPYYDSHGEAISGGEILNASAAFMEGDRVAKHQHAATDGGIGHVVFAFPLVDDVKKSLGIASVNEGLLVGIKVDDPEVQRQIDAGELTGFSIGGSAKRVTE